MSNRSLTAAFQHSRAKGSARLVILAMADEANDEGLLTAYRRSQSWIAHKANLDKSTVRRAIDTLEELGEVKVLAQGDGRTSSDYQLTLPGLASPAGDDEGAQPARPYPAPPGRAKRTPRGGESPPQGQQDAAPIIPVSPGASPSEPDQPTSDLMDESRRLCDLLADLIEQNGSRRPTVTAAWVSEGERMLRLDGREPAKVERCIRWCQADTFWRGNILSMVKLRAKYDQLRLARLRELEQQGPRAGAGAPVTADRAAPEGRVQL